MAAVQKKAIGFIILIFKQAKTGGNSITGIFEMLKKSAEELNDYLKMNIS